MSSDIEIMVGDVSDMEARVHARYGGSETGVVLRGTLRGPYCEASRTLPANFEFHESATSRGIEAIAVVTDPCMWSREMPHLYRVELQAFDGQRVVAELHSEVGLRRLAPRLPVDFAPGTG